MIDSNEDLILALMDTVAEQIPDIPERTAFYGEFMRHVTERFGNDWEGFERLKGQDEAWDEALEL